MRLRTLFVIIAFLLSLGSLACSEDPSLPSPSAQPFAIQGATLLFSPAFIGGLETCYVRGDLPDTDWSSRGARISVRDSDGWMPYTPNQRWLQPGATYRLQCVYGSQWMAFGADRICSVSPDGRKLISEYYDNNQQQWAGAVIWNGNAFESGGNADSYPCAQ